MHVILRYVIKLGMLFFVCFLCVFILRPITTVVCGMIALLQQSNGNIRYLLNEKDANSD